jgi:photosystem II stability/assembly factor-like uncharacterized protein
MKICLLAAAAISAALASFPVVAQVRGAEPPMQLHAYNPSQSLSAPTNSPFADQMRDDYAASLRGAQRQLLQQNPSGDTWQQEEISRELNGYTPH